MTEQILMITGCLLLGFLGVIHLIITIGSNKLIKTDEYDHRFATAMEDTKPVIYKSKSIWHSWLGFNYSHTFGLLWVPAVYLPLAFDELLFLHQNLWLSLLPAIMALVYAVMSKNTASAFHLLDQPWHFFVLLRHLL